MQYLAALRFTGLSNTEESYCVVADDAYIVPQVCTHSRDAVGSVPYITTLIWSDSDLPNTKSVLGKSQLFVRYSFRFVRNGDVSWLQVVCCFMVV